MKKFFRNLFFKYDSIPFLIGICIGIGISLVQTPFLRNDCINRELYRSIDIKFGNIRDLRSNDQWEEERREKFIEQYIQSNRDLEVNKKETEKQYSKLIRPRYYSTELGMRDKVLVSVLSDKDSISTFGIVINKTLNHLVDKLIFFIDGTGSKKFGLNIPIVGFKKSIPKINIFRIISYIHENYFNEFDYFLFINDHTYVNGVELIIMLQQISINQNVYMGIQANMQDLYCSFDNGVIISHSVLETLGKDLLWCTKNSFTEDVTENLGQCIRHITKLTCKSKYQSEDFNTYTLNNDEDIHVELSKLHLKNVVTIGNVKKHTDMLQIHVHNLQNLIYKTKDTIMNLRKKMKDKLQSSPLGLKVEWPIGSTLSHVPPTRHDLIRWELFNSTHLFMPNNWENVKILEGVDSRDIMSVANSSALHFQLKYPNLVSYEGIQFGYRRYDSTRGMDYIMSLLFKDNRGQLLSMRTQGFRGLTLPEMIPMPYVTENTRVMVIIFIEKSDIESVKRFLDMLSNESKMEQITVMLCIIYEKGEKYLAKDDPYMPLKLKASSLSKKYYSKQSRVSYTHLTVLTERPSYLAIFELLAPQLPNDFIVLLSEKRAIFDNLFLNRVRMNTIKGLQIFSPIPFILYHPNSIEDKVSYNRREVNKANGHFDQYYFKPISFYINDYRAARAKFVASQGYRSMAALLKNQNLSPEITPYDIFRKGSNLHILRSVEPALVLTYESVLCSNSMNNKKLLQCEARQSFSLGQRNVLTNIILDYASKRGA